MVASIQPFVVEAFVQEFRTNTPIDSYGQDLKDSKLKGLVHNEFDPITLRFMLEGNSLPMEPSREYAAKGVIWCADKWVAVGTFEGKQYHLGNYDNIIEASKVVQKFDADNVQCK